MKFIQTCLTFSGTIDLLKPQLRPAYQDFAQSMVFTRVGAGAPAPPRFFMKGVNRRRPMISANRRTTTSRRPYTTTTYRPRGSGFEQSIFANSSPMDLEDFEYDFNGPPAPPMPTTCRGGSMKIWSQTYLRGDSVTLTMDKNLEDLDFDNKLGSLEVSGFCCWEITVNLILVELQ